MRKILFPIIILFSFVGFAQQNIDSVIVSASRIPVKKYESGKNITIISKVEIDQLPVTTVNELLQYVEGVNLNNRGGFGVQSDIGMRGSTFSQVLILVDNQRINDPLTAHFNSNIPIPLSEIDHIEIVRGSAAVSYGADAVGGIIHIKTKAYEGLWKEEKSELNGNLSLGENNLLNTDLGFNQQSQKFGFYLATKTVQSDGQQFVNPNYVNANLGDSLYNNYFDLKTYTVALTYRLDKFKLYMRAGADQRDFAAKYFYTASNYDESTEFVNSYWTQTSAIYDNESSKTELNMSYRNNSDSFVFNPLFAPNSHTTERYNATLSQNRKIGNFTLSYGLQSDFQSIISTDRGNHKIVSNAAFILAQKKINNLNLNSGLRVEYSEKIGIQVVPQINLSLPYKNYIFRSSIGRSIRQADFTERYVSYNIPALGAGRNAGNPDLNAESAYSFDLGVDHYVNKKLTWNYTLFLRQSSNLIDYVLTPSSEIQNLPNLKDSASYLYAKNISEATTLGSELSLKYKMELPTISIDWLLNYTLLKTTAPSSVVSKYIANHPTNNLNGAATIQYGRFIWNIGGTLITRDEDRATAINAKINSNYVVVNSKLSYNSKTMPVSIYLDARNLLDTHYQEILGAQMPNRWLLAGVSWKFHYMKVKLPVF